MKTLSTNEYKAGGLKYSFHGGIYQLKLLMFFLKCGTDEGYDFYLSTEWDAAEKFDDLVFKYTDSRNQVHYRFLQAKHKQEESKKIEIGDLLTTDKHGEFNLAKYFVSYLKIKNNQNFRDGNLEDFIICTNIGFNLDDATQGQVRKLKEMQSGKKHKKEILVKEITSSDVFFRGVRYRFSNVDDMLLMLESGFKNAIQEEAEKLKKV